MEIKELIKPIRRNDKLEYHITAPQPGWLQVDLMVMQKEASRNKNYNYGLVAIDIYSRYGWCIPIKTKSANDTKSAFQKILEGKTMPIETITTDNGSEWKGEFGVLLKKHNIYHKMVEVGDHHSMGIVDAFIKNLRRRILTVWLTNHNLDWVSHINQILKDYNNHLHSTIRTTPNKIIRKESTPALQIKIVEELKPGQHVRIKLSRDKFDKKSSIQNWSAEVYKVKEKEGNRYLLEGKPGRWALYELQKTKFPINKTVVLPTGRHSRKPVTVKQKEIKEKAKVKRFIRKEGIDQKNIVRTRTRNQLKRG